MKLEISIAWFWDTEEEGNVQGGEYWFMELTDAVDTQFFVVFKQGFMGEGGGEGWGGSSISMLLSLLLVPPSMMVVVEVSISKEARSVAVIIVVPESERIELSECRCVFGRLRRKRFVNASEEDITIIIRIAMNCIA